MSLLCERFLAAASASKKPASLPANRQSRSFDQPRLNRDAEEPCSRSIGHGLCRRVTSTAFFDAVKGWQQFFC